MDQAFPGAEGLVMALPILIGLIALLVGIAIAVVICLLISGCFQRIPQEFRLMEPAMVWLLLIPCFSLIWNFFVWPKLADSYKNYFDSVGNTEVGDCGKGLNMAYCIVCVCGVIPCVGYLAWPASIVLLIICLVKALSFKNQIDLA
ncbi:hypothetical protein ACFL1X_03730 [Candidatus Hydrogenedentota bacterium]